MDYNDIFEGTSQEALEFFKENSHKYQRSVAGSIKIDGINFKFVDFHSLVHEFVQIFAHDNYGINGNVVINKILDCGAHIGLASIYFSIKHPSANIIAFEADTEIANVAESNIKECGLTNKIQITNAAVWTHNKGVSFNCKKNDSGHVAEEGQGIRSIRLRDVILQEKPEFLKLDIEGSEVQVLRDCIDALRGVKLLIVEYHKLKSEDLSLYELLRNIELAGFNYSLSDFHPATWIPNNLKIPFNGCQNEYFIVTVYAWRPDECY